MFSTDYPDGPTDKAKIDSREYCGELLGKNELGTVHLHSTLGNKESDIKIALKFSYYVYNIDVNVLDEETEGRMDGQLLAQEFVAPHIIENNYDFFADIHANKGLRGPGKYEKTNFLFAPGFDDLSTMHMNKLLSEIPELEYYAPEYRTSPEYITVPVANSGIPTIVYETFSYEPMEKSYCLAEKIVDAIDNLELI